MKIEVWTVSTDFDDGTSGTWIEFRIPDLRYIMVDDSPNEWISDIRAYEPGLNFFDHYKHKNYQSGFYYEYLGEL